MCPQIPQARARPAHDGMGSRSRPLRTSRYIGKREVVVARPTWAGVAAAKLDQRPLRDGAQPFHRGDALAEGQQARAEPVVGADSFHRPDRRQLAQQPINRGAGSADSAVSSVRRARPSARRILSSSNADSITPGPAIPPFPPHCALSVHIPRWPPAGWPLDHFNTRTRRRHSRGRVAADVH